MDARPPGGPNSFNFMQFLWNFGKIVCSPHPRRVGAPTSGKSWIRHWISRRVFKSESSRGGGGGGGGGSKYERFWMFLKSWELHTFPDFCQCLRKIRISTCFSMDIKREEGFCEKRKNYPTSALGAWVLHKICLVYFT